MHSRDITVENRQRKVRIDLAWLRSFAAAALAECEKHPAAPGAALAGLEAVEVSFISDAAIAKVHWRFMQIAGPTDVITFDHGEILISAETARDNAARYGQELGHELGLYIIHGLLHLAGHNDKKPVEATRMRRLQEKILARLLKGRSVLD